MSREGPAIAGAGARGSWGAQEVRRECAKLLARRLGDGYELRCGRCKTLWLLPANMGEGPLELEASRRRA